jgi:hypothetical protein
MCLSTPSPTTVNKRQAMSTSNHGIAKRPKTNLFLKRINTVVTDKPNASVKDLLNGDLVKTKVSTPPTSDTPNVRLGTKAFIQIMLHTRSCSSCEDSKCKKMKMVMSHYIQCTKLKNGQQCPLCRQLIRVISEHALYLCPNRADGMKFPCPVPMCDIMRASAALKKNI